MASPQGSREAVRRFELVPGREEPKYGESATLEYETIPCLERIGRSVEKYSVPLRRRETEFGRQVISPKRGCYR